MPPNVAKCFLLFTNFVLFFLSLSFFDSDTNFFRNFFKKKKKKKRAKTKRLPTAEREINAS